MRGWNLAATAGAEAVQFGERTVCADSAPVKVASAVRNITVGFILPRLLIVAPTLAAGSAAAIHCSTAQRPVT
jgi:hypothetical protein